jgi:hypothetical protein
MSLVIAGAHPRNQRLVSWVGTALQISHVFSECATEETQDGTDPKENA